MVRGVFSCVILLLFGYTSSFSLEGFDFSSLHPADFKVVVKKVGQGSCSILRNQFNGETVIIDAGSSSNTPFGLEERIAEELGEASVSSDLPSFAGKITMVISHTDQDHINYFHRVFGKNSKLFNRVSRVFLGDHLANYYKSTEAKIFLRSVVGNLRDPSSQAISLSHSTPITPEIISAEEEDDSLFTDASYRGYQEHFSIDSFLDPSQRREARFLELLSMNAGADTKHLRNENANSCIVRLSIHGQNILVMGDATGLTTRRVLLNPKNREHLETALLIASHHGAKEHETNNGLWLSTIKPKRVVVSAGYRDKWFHPRAEFIMDLMIVDSLQKQKSDLPENQDPHDFSLSGDEENTKFYIDSLTPYMIFKSPHPKEKRWLVFQSEKAIYGTASSGDITHVYNHLGQLVDFYREN